MGECWKCRQIDEGDAPLFREAPEVIAAQAYWRWDRKWCVRVTSKAGDECWEHARAEVYEQLTTDEALDVLLACFSESFQR